MHELNEPFLAIILSALNHHWQNKNPSDSYAEIFAEAIACSAIAEMIKMQADDCENGLEKSCKKLRNSLELKKGEEAPQKVMEAFDAMYAFYSNPHHKAVAQDRSRDYDKKAEKLMAEHSRKTTELKNRDKTSSQSTKGSGRKARLNATSRALHEEKPGKKSTSADDAGEQRTTSRSRKSSLKNSPTLFAQSKRSPQDTEGKKSSSKTQAEHSAKEGRSGNKKKGAPCEDVFDNVIMEDEIATFDCSF